MTKIEKAVTIAIGKEDKCEEVRGTSCTCGKSSTLWLVVKRSSADVIPDFWEFPGGGAEDGEDAEITAKRELAEETALKPEVLHISGKSMVPSILNPSVSFDFHHFTCTGFIGELKLSEEHSEYKWLPKEEILALKRVSPATLNHLKLLE